jgi:uncharacterized membrane protein YphA (DoxX/SURF4 family)
VAGKLSLKLCQHVRQMCPWMRVLCVSCLLLGLQQRVLAAVTAVFYI